MQRRYQSWYRSTGEGQEPAVTCGTSGGGWLWPPYPAARSAEPAVAPPGEGH